MIHIFFPVESIMYGVYTIRFTISLVESKMYGLYIPLDSWFTYFQHWINDAYGIYTIRFIIHIFSPIGSMVCGFVNSIICIDFFFLLIWWNRAFPPLDQWFTPYLLLNQIFQALQGYIYNHCSIPMLQTQLS